MRADRLLGILLLLQRSGRVTARELARRLEVSVRTIYRDIEALGAAGVPVYAEPGRNGGVRLLEGYATDLSGLSLSEAELVPLVGLSDVFTAMGIGGPVRRTEEKLLAALPSEQRKRAERSRRRLHVDLSRWWETAESSPHLASVVEGVLAGRRLRINYRRGEAAKETRRKVDPYGVVVQGGVWYLVARADARQPRIYRISRIVSAQPTEERFDVPDDFDLSSFWAHRKEEFHMTRPGYRVRARARAAAIRALTDRHGWDAHVEATEDEWTTISVSFETYWTTLERMLGLGANVIVLEPPELRDAVSDAVARMHALYTT